jgi:murein DD-endopeptidase MepM/ murein hydrolase activator NlpD
MERGDRGWDVAAMQYILARRGYPPGAIDAVFGAMTESALRGFQRAYGLPGEGRAGRRTIAAMRRKSPAQRALTLPAPDVRLRLLRPVPGPIGDRFGAPRKGGRSHTGIDFPVPSGTRIGAAAAGVTEFAGRNTGGYGNLVVVRHGNGLTTWYAHMSSIATSAGERVSRGTLLGFVGSTGRSTGPHLHFELRRDAVPIDPEPYLLRAVATGNGGTGGGIAAGACPIREPLVRYARAHIDACIAKNLTRAH